MFCVCLSCFPKLLEDKACFTFLPHPSAEEMLPWTCTRHSHSYSPGYVLLVGPVQMHSTTPDTESAVVNMMVHSWASGALEPAHMSNGPRLYLSSQLCVQWSRLGSLRLGHARTIYMMQTVQLILSILNIRTLSSTSFLFHLAYKLFYI